MRIALLRIKKHVHSIHLLRCFEQGAVACGDSCSWATFPKEIEAAVGDCDLAVRVAPPPPVNSPEGRTETETAAAAFERAGKPIFTIDTGFIRNKMEYEVASASGRCATPKFNSRDPSTFSAVDDLMYYSIGCGDPKGRANYCNRGVPSDRWAALKIDEKPWRETGRHILLLGSSRGRGRHSIDIGSWYAAVIASIRQRTKREIVFRFNPRAGKRRGARESILQHVGKPAKFSFSRNPRLEDDLQDAWAAVTWSSNAAAAAIIFGIPVFAGDKLCIAWDVANHDLAAIREPTMPDRTNWLRELAYAQWNCREISSGVAWKRLRSSILDGSWRVACV